MKNTFPTAKSWDSILLLSRKIHSVGITFPFNMHSFFVFMSVRKTTG